MIYLGGPIRKTQAGFIYLSDHSWRDTITYDYGFMYFFNPNTLAKYTDNFKIYSNDISMLDDSEFGVFNLNAFDDDKYPCIGALFEIGYLTARGKRCIVLCKPDSILKTHPMLHGCLFVNNWYMLEILVGEVVKHLRSGREFDQFLDLDFDNFYRRNNVKKTDNIP